MKPMTLVALAALVPAAAFAQGAPKATAKTPPPATQPAGDAAQDQGDQAGDQGEGDQSDQGDGSVNLNEQAGAPEGAMPAGKGPAVPPPESYTVKPGDTLWDISSRFLNSPWYWPKVWSYNPEITNPNWINPGDTIRFMPGPEGAPAQVQPEEPEGEGPVAAPTEAPDFAKVGKTPEDLGVDEDMVTVAGAKRIGFVIPKNFAVQRQGFVTQRELEEAGRISASFEEKIFLAENDEAYARFRNMASVKPGGTFLVFRTDRRVTEPRTRAFFGYLTVILGQARVTSVSNGVATIVLEKSFQPMQRGDYLGPWSDKFLKPVAPRPNARSLVATIIAAQHDSITELGENHTVYIDKGKAEGVEDGNTLVVTRAGDQYGRPINDYTSDPNFPKEDIGRLIVVDAKDHASQCLVVKSLRELYIGDRAEMRPETGPAGQPVGQAPAAAGAGGF